MAHRPYPNVDRALKQIDRHYPPAPVIPMPPALRAVGESIGRLRENTQRAAGQGFGAGRYVLSTRRPSVSPEVANRYPAEFIDQINHPPRPGVVSGSP